MRSRISVPQTALFCFDVLRTCSYDFQIILSCGSVKFATGTVSRNISMRWKVYFITTFLRAPSWYSSVAFHEGKKITVDKATHSTPNDLAEDLAVDSNKKLFAMVF